MNYIIETNNLTKRFGTHVSVDSINLRVPRGKIYGFLGANGAGKTTTIRMLLSLIRPNHGTVQIMGHSLQHERETILKKVGCLVEAPSYYGHLSAYKNLKIITRLLDLPDANINNVLDVVRLTSYAGQAVKGYSLGMKQRLGIAQALIREPELLILDEPINGLDPAGIQEIRNLMLSLSREQGKTIFLSSHILSEIQSISDYVGIIKDGKLIFQDSMEELERLNKSWLCVITGQPAEAFETLTRHGGEVKQHGNELLIAITKQMSQEDIFTLLKPYSILHVSECTRSLEDIFLQMTGTGESL